MPNCESKRSITERWGTNYGFILAATGAAVGLGNIWKFPYMAGNNGGASFVFVYLIAIVLIGLPLMLTEILLGYLGRASTINAFTKFASLYKCSGNWKYIGWLGAVILLLTLSFYSVIASWSLAYFFKYLGFVINVLNSPSSMKEISSNWSDFLSSPLALLFWHTAFMIITVGIVKLGVIKGIEKSSNIMMPFLFIILFLLAIYSFFNGDFYAGYNFLFHIDFSKITASVIIDALGHALFTLAVGAGCMLTYGAYLQENTSILKSVLIVAVLDVSVAFLSGISIFPLVFIYGLEPTAGPDLMFKVLPIAFLQMPIGNIIACLFFLLLTFAALTSSISFVEPLVVILMERVNLSRSRCCIVIGFFAWVLGIASLLSFNICSDLLFFGRWTFFDMITGITTNFLLPLGGLLFSIFTGWVLSKSVREPVLFNGNKSLHSLWLFLIKYFVPLSTLLILFVNIF